MHELMTLQTALGLELLPTQVTQVGLLRVVPVHVCLEIALTP